MSHFAAVLDANVLYSHLIDLSPKLVRARLLAMIARHRNPPTPVGDYIAILERQSLPETAAALRDLLVDES